MANRRIILATSNPAKRQQLRWLLEGLPLEPVEVDAVEVAEDAGNLAGNAAAKAYAYSCAGQSIRDDLAIASDGGLYVPALGDAWEPTQTRRLGQRRLSELTRDLSDRGVQWWEAVAVTDRGRLVKMWTRAGTEGVLTPEPWPPPGDFWVWDIFMFPELGKTWAELTPAERTAEDLTWTGLKGDVQAFFS